MLLGALGALLSGIAAIIQALRPSDGRAKKGRRTQSAPPLRRNKSFVLGVALLLLSAVLLTYSRCQPSETEIRVTRPRDGSLVGYEERIEGTSKGLARGRNVWIIVKPVSSSRFHPQVGPVKFRADGSWDGPAFFGAGPTSGVGEEFSVFAIVPSSDGDVSLQQYVDTADRMDIQGWSACRVAQRSRTR